MSEKDLPPSDSSSQPPANKPADTPATAADNTTGAAAQDASAQQGNQGKQGDERPGGTNQPNPVIAKQPVVSQKKNKNISWIWLVPLIAAIIGLSLLVRDYMQQGPVATVTFKTAEGLEVDKTQVRYKDVVVGVVSDIDLTEDHNSVQVTISFTDGVDFLLREGARFWVVKPRLGVSGVSGLGTLVSGAYIGVDIDDTKQTKAEPRNDFVGLEKPPELISGRPGKRFTITAPSLNSLDLGSPVLYRRLQVGQVINYTLSKEGKGVEVQIFIDAPYDRFVTENSRFWNASGVDLSLNAGGLNLKTQSLVSVLAGGIAFGQLPAEEEAKEAVKPAADGATFVLNPSEEKALAKPDGLAFPIRMKFDKSVRGLQTGSAIDFKGILLGEVKDISMEFDIATRKTTVIVDGVIYENRLGAAIPDAQRFDDKGEPVHDLALKEFVSSGIQAQLRFANIFTGQLYVALDYFPEIAKKPPAPDLSKSPVEVATVPGSFDELQQQLNVIVEKLKNLPIDSIGHSLDDALQSISKLARTLDTTMVPELTSTVRKAGKSLDGVNKTMGSVRGVVNDDSPVMLQLNGMIKELSRAAKSIRSLGDYLQAEPSSLIRGRSKDNIPFKESE
ncbi:paraquat-inducible protein B [Advenella kashmirensis W13003]|uniref:Paraquat-inducible protein B n=1 Tax=Advenella kashmirensis W13003 TaxID=1424334 RepID=V8QMN6_9BURK|nr:MlaD family protein [Advenella kashmirensis]ETF00269.1 paraquat-inducible protein B [Advenella kashmirensis W13003]